MEMVTRVSILVMLDDALVLILTILSDGTDNLRLNPCYAGRCSSTLKKKKLIMKRSLNPCYAGRCSSTCLKLILKL